MQDQNVQFIVRWQSKITGYRGHGEPMDKDMALAWIVEMNEKFPEICHWAERVFEGGD